MTGSTPTTAASAQAIGSADAAVRADGAELVRLLQSQRDVLLRLDALGQRQSECVRAQQPQPLADLLAQRRRLIDRIEQLNDELGRFRNATPPAIPADRRDEAAELLKQIEQLRQRVLQRDRDDAGVLARRRDELGLRVREASRVGRAAQAYRGPGAADAHNRFADRTG
jgi:cell division septum initiation protein DivIVA